MDNHDKTQCKFWGFQDSEDSSNGLLGCDTVLWCGIIQSWRWDQWGPLKQWYPITSLHAVTT
jgi:hypothetical protein